MSKITQRPDMLLYGKIAQRKVGYVAGQIEITSYCKQRCSFCDSWKQHYTKRIAGAISLQKMSELTDQLNNTRTFEHLTMTGGEPQNWVDPRNRSTKFEDLLTMLASRKNFSLQVNTNLCEDINVDLWRTALQRIRVSFDGCTPKTYEKCRGVKQDPKEILKRIEDLNHPGLATMTCVSPLNIDEIPEIIHTLNTMKNPPRKAMFLAVLDSKVDMEFWRKFELLKYMNSPRVNTSFSEDVIEVRNFVQSEEAEKIPCYAGSISFHIKCNGDVYPCCLIGGEAIKTREEMCIGNIYRLSLKLIQKGYTPTCHYKNDSPCQAVCQWKQLQINRIADAADKTTLTMP